MQIVTDRAQGESEDRRNIDSMSRSATFEVREHFPGYVLGRTGSCAGETSCGVLEH
jgi:hypothetical protein